MAWCFSTRPSVATVLDASVATVLSLFPAVYELTGNVDHQDYSYIPDNESKDISENRYDYIDSYL